MPKWSLPSKDPDNIEPFFVVWCSEDGTNDGSSSDTGELQGATIQSSSWTVPSGITEVSNNTSELTIQGVSYSANTCATIYLSGGTVNTDYVLVNEIETDDNRTLQKSITIRVRDN